MEPPKTEAPNCFLCHKAPDATPCKGGLVKFSDYAEDQREISLGSRHGEKWFCEDHLEAAQALSHLSAGEALSELRRKFGTFEDLELVRTPPPFWLKGPGPVYLVLAMFMTFVIIGLLVTAFSR